MEDRICRLACLASLPGPPCPAFSFPSPSLPPLLASSPLSPSEFPPCCWWWMLSRPPRVYIFTALLSTAVSPKFYFPTQVFAPGVPSIPTLSLSLSFSLSAGWRLQLLWVSVSAINDFQLHALTEIGAQYMLPDSLTYVTIHIINLPARKYQLLILFSVVAYLGPVRTIRALFNLLWEEDHQLIHY